MSYLEGGLRRQPTMTAAIYLGELVFAVGLAVVLLTTSTFASSVATLLFCCGVDRGRIPHASLCVACHFPGRTQASPRTTARRCRQGLLANIAPVLRCLPDYGTRRSGRRSRRLRMVFVRPLLRPS